MKIGILGPIGGLILAAGILGAFVYFTPTDSPARIGGFVLALAVFVGAVALAIRGEKGRP